LIPVIAIPLALPAQVTQTSYQIPWVQVTTLPGKEIQPALSPDGKWLAFVADQNDNQDIWVMPAAGGVAIPLTTHSGADYAPTWTPDSRALVFVSTRDDALGDLWWLSLRSFEGEIAPSGRPQKLTNYQGADDSPSVSPDGRQIAFASQRDGKENIWLLDREKNTVNQLTIDGGRQPVWLTDGRNILFTRIGKDDRRGNMYVAAITDTGKPSLKPVALTEFVQGFPTLSPNGTEMAWVRITRDTNRDGVLDWADGSSLWKRTLDPETSAPPVQLTLDNDYDLYPHWGSDGWLYHSSNRGDDVDIWKVPAAGPIPSKPTAGEQFHLGETYLAGALASARQPSTEELELSRLCFQKVITDFPDSAEWCAKAWYRISRLYGMQDLTSQQTYVLRRILRFYSQYPDVSALAAVDYQVILWHQSFQPGQDTLFTTASAAMVDNLRNFISTNPDQIRATSMARLWIANAYYLAKRDNKALEEYIALRNIGQPPDIAAEAQFQIAAIFEKFGQGKEVVQSYLKVLQDYPNQVEWNRKAIDHIIDLTVSDEFTASPVEGLQQIIQEFPDVTNLTAAAQLGIGKALQSQSEYDLAILELERLEGYRRRTPNTFIRSLSAEARLHIATIYLDQGYTNEAITWFRKVIDQDGDLAEGSYSYQATTRLLHTLTVRGKNLERQNDYRLALAEFQRAISLDSSLLPAWQGMIRVSHHLNRLPQMQRQIENALKDDPENPLLWYAMGLLLSYKHSNSFRGIQESNRWLEGAIARQSSLTPAYVTLGYNYIGLDHLGEKSRKPSLWERVRDSFTTLSYWVRLRRQPQQIDWLERAINILRTGIALNDERKDPDTEAKLLVNLGNAYYKLGEFGYELAASSYRRGLDLNAEFRSMEHQALVKERLGHSLTFVGKYSDAAHQLNLARELYVQMGNPKNEWRILLRLAELYTLSSDNDRAAETYADISSRIDRVGKTDSKALWLRNIAQSNLELKDWGAANRYAQLALEQLDSSQVFKKTKIKNYLKLKILGLPIPLINFGPLGTGTSKAEGFSVRDEWELNQSIREIAASGAKDFHTMRQVTSERLHVAEITKDRDMQARLTYRLGIVEYHLGNYYQAVNRLNQVTQICLDNPDITGAASGAMRGMIARGNLLLTIGATQDTLTYQELAKQVNSWETDLTRTLSFAKRSIGKPTRDQAVLLNLHACLLYSQFLKANPTTADQAFQKWLLPNRIDSLFLEALSLAQKNNHALETAVIEHNLGQFHTEFGSPEKAATHLHNAYRIAVANQLPEVLWRTQTALALLRIVANPDITNPEPSQGSTFLFQKTAWEWIQEALTVMENQPMRPEKHEELVNHRLSARQTYLLSMDILLEENHNDTTLLEMAERKNALEWLWAANARPFAVKKETQKFIWGQGGGNAPFLQKELQRLSATLRSEREKDKPNLELIADLESEYRFNFKEYQELLDQVWADDPEFGSLFSLRPATVSQVQTSMDSNEAILRTIIHRSQPLSWLILPDTLRRLSHPLKPESLPLIQTDSLKWTWILDPCILHYPVDSLQFMGIPTPGSLVSRVPDFRTYLVQPSKREVPGSNAVILYRSLDKITPVNLPPNWTPLNTDTASTNQVMESLSQANLIVIDLPIVANVQQPLTSYFDMGSDHLQFSQLFSTDLSAAAALIRWNPENVDSRHQGIILNALFRSLMFAGIPSVVMVPCRDFDLEAAANFNYSLLQRNAAQTLAMSNSAANQPFRNWILLGANGMTPTEVNHYAKENLNRTVLKGNLNLRDGNTVWATRYYRRARQMARTLNQQNILPNIDRLLLKSAVDGSRWQEAEQIQQRLLDIARQSNDIDGIVQAWSNLAVFRSRSRNITGALNAWNQVLSVAQATNDNNTRANALLSQSDLYRTARQDSFALQAVAIAQDIAQDMNNSQLLLTCLTQKAKILFEFDDIEGALTSIVDAQRLLDEAAPSETTSQLSVTILELKGRILAILGRFPEALSCTQQALNSAGQDTVQLGYLTQRMADLYWESGKLTLANHWAQKADSLFAIVGDKSYQLLNQNTRSLIALSLGKRDLAVMLAGTALELATDIRDSANMATITRNMGLVDLESGRTEQAILRFREAYKLDQHLNRTAGTAHDLANLGLTFLRYGWIDSARTALTSAISIAKPLSDRRPEVKARLGMALVEFHQGNHQKALVMLDTTQAATQNRPLGEYLWRIWYHRGQIHLKQNEPTAALEAFERAIHVLENDPVASRDYRPTGITGQPHHPFDIAVKTALETDDVESAFLLSDRKRRWVRHQPFQLEGITNPQTPNRDITWNNIKQNLPPNTLLLSYHLTADTTWLFVANHNTLECLGIAGGETSVTSLVEDFGTAVEKLLSVENTSRTLYRSLLSPAEPWLQSAHQLIILPSGPLWSVPFCALTDDNGTMIVDRLPILYLQGLDRLQKTMIPQDHTFRQLWALAVPRSPKVPGELIFAEREVRRIALEESLAKAYIAEHATEAFLDTSNLSGTALHIATHGWSNPDDPLSTGILLSESTGSDGMWQAREIARRQRQSPLIFLNLCPQDQQTGNRRQRLLTASFTEAGCRTVISPLWKMDDLAAAVTAKLFYRYLREATQEERTAHLPSKIARTLQKTQIGVRDKVNAHPAYWAAYLLQY
jgi:Tol biopolymer transport system component/tetratricopeptide (TPR) repeat protein